MPTLPTYCGDALEQVHEVVYLLSLTYHQDLRLAPIWGGIFICGTPTIRERKSFC